MQTTLLSLRDMAPPASPPDRPAPDLRRNERSFGDALREQRRNAEDTPVERRDAPQVKARNEDEREAPRTERSEDVNDSAQAADRAEHAESAPETDTASADQGDQTAAEPANEPRASEPEAAHEPSGQVASPHVIAQTASNADAQILPNHDLTGAESTTVDAESSASTTATITESSDTADRPVTNGAAGKNTAHTNNTVPGDTEAVHRASTRVSPSGHEAGVERKDASTAARQGVGDARGALHGGKGPESPPIAPTSPGDPGSRTTSVPVAASAAPASSESPAPAAPAPVPVDRASTAAPAVSNDVASAPAPRFTDEREPRGDGNQDRSGRDSGRSSSGTPLPAQARAAQVESQLRAESGGFQVNERAEPAPAPMRSAAPGNPAPPAMDVRAPEPPEPPATSRIARGLSAMVNQRGGVMTMRLSPPAMGTLRIQMTMTQGTVAAQFTATTAQAQAMLEQSLPMLRTALESHGLQVERLGVQLSSSDASGQPRTDAQGQQGQAQDGGGRHDAADGESRGRQDGDARKHDGARHDALRPFADRLDAEAFRTSLGSDTPDDEGQAA